MRVLMFSRDKNIFTQGTGAYQRHQAYRGLVRNLRVIAFGKWFIKSEGDMPARPDLVVAQDPFETGLLALFYAKMCGAHLQIQIHTDFLNPLWRGESFLNSIRAEIARCILPRATCVRVVSHRIKRSLVAAGLAPASRVTVIPVYAGAGREVSARESSSPTPSVRRPSFSHTLLMVSRLVREKNIPMALEVFKRLLEQFPRAGLIIVGTGPLLPRLTELVTSLGIEKNVVFEGWKNDPSSYYEGADVFLLASDYEGYGMTLVEAARVGCPIVSTDVGLVGELLGPAEAGIVPPRDPEALLVAIKEVLTDAPMRQARADSAQKRVTQLPSWEEYLKLYQESWTLCGKN